MPHPYKWSLSRLTAYFTIEDGYFRSSQSHTISVLTFNLSTCSHSPRPKKQDCCFDQAWKSSSCDTTFIGPSKQGCGHLNYVLCLFVEHEGDLQSCRDTPPRAPLDQPPRGEPLGGPEDLTYPPNPGTVPVWSSTPPLLVKTVSRDKVPRFHQEGRGNCRFFL